MAQHENTFRDLGGWNQFGNLVKHCQTGHCQGCLQELSHAIDYLPTHTTEPNSDEKPIWLMKNHLQTAKNVN